MKKDAIRTAVIGMGNMGSQYAALLAAGAVPEMALAAVTRVRPETLAARGLALPAGLPVYQTAEELFAAVDGGARGLDAGVGATPHRLHEEQAVAAMERGLCVLCDKPAGITSAAARRMEQARPAGLVCGYIFQQRTFPSYRAIRQLQPIRWTDENKSAGGVPLGKSYVGIVDVLQNKNSIVISAEFGRVEVSWVGICVQFCHSPAIFHGNGVAHLAERFFVQMRRRSSGRAPKSSNSSWKYYFIVLYSQLCS